MNEIDLSAILKNEGDIRIERQPLPERVAEQLRKLILLETLPPGATLNEREMANVLGVSRTPLREALRVLANEGLIDVFPNRPPRIADPSIDEILQLIEVQAALEGLAGEIAAVSATDRDLQHIADLHQEMISASDQLEPIDFFDLDMRFHRRIVEISANKPLLQAHAMYNSRLYRARFIYSSGANVRASTLDQHGDIAVALKARDAEGARLALRTHLRSTGKNIISAPKRTDDVGKLPSPGA